MTAVQLALVGEDQPVVPRPRGVKRKGSRGRRTTERQLLALAAGLHPLSNAVGYTIKLHADAAPPDSRRAPGLRCGECRYRRLIGWHNRVYPKCLFGEIELDAARHFFDLLPRVSHGQGTDVRRWWPACEDFELGDRLSDDAARWRP